MTPEQLDAIIDAVAKRLLIVSPIPPYFPLSRAFTRECMVEVLEAVEAHRAAKQGHRPPPGDPVNAAEVAKLPAVDMGRHPGA